MSTLFGNVIQYSSQVVFNGIKKKLSFPPLCTPSLLIRNDNMLKLYFRLISSFMFNYGTNYITFYSMYASTDL